MARLIATEEQVQLAEAMEAQDSNKWDKDLQVYFYDGAALDGVRTLALKKPCFEDKVFVHIQVPGDRTMTYDQPAVIDEENEHNKEAHNNRFPKQWVRYQAGHRDGAQGTPLTALPLEVLKPAQREELMYFKVRTVEALAALTDGNLQRLGPGFQAARSSARAFLQAQKGTVAVAEFQDELGKRDAEIAALKAQMEQLMGSAQRPVELKPVDAGVAPPQRKAKGKTQLER